LILNEVLNNEEELIHIDSLITFKDLIKRFCESQNSNLNKETNVKSKLSDEENSIIENIKINIEKTYEKCEGLLINSELTKNAYDAKDILVIITEYNSEYKLRSLKISIKLISQFLNDKKFKYNFIL